MAERTYSQDEIARILDAASKRQAATQGSGGAGLTLSELEEVAAASGIAPEHVAAAAAALTGAPAASTRFLSMPVDVEGSRLIPGAVSDETWSKMVAELRRAFGGPGVVSGDGRMRTWSTAPSRRSSPVVVSLEPEGNHTRLTLGQSVRERVTRLAIPSGLFVGFALVMATAAAILQEGDMLVATLMFTLFAAMFQIASQVGTRVWSRDRTRQFSAVADRLELVARSAVPAEGATAATPSAVTSTPAPAVSARPVLTLDAEMPEDEENQAARAGRRTHS